MRNARVNWLCFLSYCNIYGNICTVTGEGTSFWNIVRHSFTINFVLAVFLRGVSIRTYVVDNQLICDVRRQKVHLLPHCRTSRYPLKVPAGITYPGTFDVQKHRKKQSSAIL